VRREEEREERESQRERERKRERGRERQMDCATKRQLKSNREFEVLYLELGGQLQFRLQPLVDFEALLAALGLDLENTVRGSSRAPPPPLPASGKADKRK
jgi:hypothetical protein